VIVTATNGAGDANSTSAASAVIADAIPVSTVLPTISGTTTDGLTLTATQGTFSADNLSYAYQWQSSGDGINWTNISGATTTTYQLTSTDVAKQIRVLVTATNSAGNVVATSLNTPAVAEQAPSGNTAPVVTGTTSPVLAATTGTFSGDSLTYSYQWEDCDTSGNNCAPIVNAIESTYALTTTDVGHTLVVVVTATNSITSATSTSTPTPIILASQVPSVTPPGNNPPGNQDPGVTPPGQGPGITPPGQGPGNTGTTPVTVLPPSSGLVLSVKGHARVGVTLRSTGVAASTGLTIQYQWLSCNFHGKDCQVIKGATTTHLKLSRKLLWHRVELTALLTNSAGHATAHSKLSLTIRKPVVR
jgi:hypothetical protein